MSGIYLHIPFCKQACNYCDFHFSTRLNNKGDVVNSILKEIEVRKEYLIDKNLKSIYFGGGTPSLLTNTELAMIMERLRAGFSFNKDIEITLEANPDDINKIKLEEWGREGINRLSIGLQSFNEEELKWMNRAHSAVESVNSVKMAQDKGFENISIDLIYGSKFQTLLSWEKTLLQALDLSTRHISSYNLTIENKTVLGTKLSKGNEPAVNDELSSSQFLLMLEMLADNEFIQYEISNFGKKNYFAVHNTNYWLGEHYLGLGPSAHSFNGNSRQWNIKNNSLYSERLKTGKAFFEVESLSLKEKYNEYVLTRLRTIWGCDSKEIEAQFGFSVADHFKKLIRKKNNFIIENSGVFTLNKAGKLQADGIAAYLFL
ncbi:MAG: coproporphyrinogen oxidase [Bacteroidetes bacterium]|nr:coproporphyrinogen oxidase [Bacteroidota bacterium]